MFVKGYGLLNISWWGDPAFLFHGCTAPGILATGAGSTMVIAEGDKTLGDTIDDATIKLNISS